MRSRGISSDPCRSPPGRRGRRGRAAAALLIVAALAAPARAQTESARVEVDEPRAYGWMVGDVVERSVRLVLPPGTVVDAASLPQPGRRGQALELRHVAFRQGRELWLEYQVMLSPPEPRVLEMPGFELQLRDAAGRASALRVDAWPVGVVPLVAREAPSRRGFGELQPDLPPPPVATDGHRRRLAAALALSLVVAAYLLHVQIALPWWARRRRVAIATRTTATTSRTPTRTVNVNTVT